ncbi:hypothetical protein M3650_30840 [Paenibacillus sp. MER TA 81-3]|nr:hypothetical protein [Paenibacillus sp. MER TA 81-3]
MAYRKNVEDRAIRRRTSSAFAKWAKATVPATPAVRTTRVHPFGGYRRAPAPPKVAGTPPYRRTT